MLKKLVVLLIIAATFFGFAYYIYSNPEIIHTLTSLSIATILSLVVGYTLLMLINALILHWSLRYIGHRMDYVENILLTGYSSIANFFGPLQSGPGVRAVYLKKRHGVKIKDFSITLVLFYGFFAAINGIVLLLALAQQYASPLAYSILAIIVVTGIIAAATITRTSQKALQVIRKIRLDDRYLWMIALGAAMTFAVSIFIYFVELAHMTSIGLGQVVLYTAAANLALFVSLTPGAIGIRESFVLITQQLHGIDTNSIIGANIIDRAFFIGFLLVLFVILLAINSRKHLPVLSKQNR